MIITKQFIMDMGVCGESLVWYEGIFGTGPHPYFTVYNAVSSTEDIDEDTRQQWLKWCNELQVNVDAIKYDGSYYMGRYYVLGVGLNAYFDTLDEAVTAYNEAYETRYNDPDLFSVSEVVEDGSSTIFIPSSIIVDSVTYAVYNSHDGSRVNMLGSDIAAYKLGKIEQLKVTEAPLWKIRQEVIDTDDNFVGLEPVEV